MPTKLKESKKFCTVPEYAARLGSGVKRIHALIQTGQLKAINVAVNRAGRPRFLISENAAAEFEQARAVVPDEKPPVRSRRRRDAVPHYE